MKQAAAKISLVVCALAAALLGIGYLQAQSVPPALGNKIIHPYSDFLLHNIGTGDGIPFLPQPEFASTAKQIRTAPLWALRTRNRLMHDGLSFTKEEAIQRHAGQAEQVKRKFNALTRAERDQIVSFPGVALESSLVEQTRNFGT